MNLKFLLSKSSLEVIAALVGIVATLYGAIQYVDLRISEKVRLKGFVINILASNNVEEYDETLNMWNMYVSDFGKDAFSSSEKVVLYDALLLAAANSRNPYRHRNMIKEFASRYDFVLQDTSFRSHQLGWLDMMVDDCKSAVLRYREAVKLAQLEGSGSNFDGYRGMFYCALSMGDKEIFDESRRFLVNAYFEGDKDLAREVFSLKGTFMYNALNLVSGKVFSNNIDAYISAVRNNAPVVLTERNS